MQKIRSIEISASVADGTQFKLVVRFEPHPALVQANYYRLLDDDEQRGLSLEDAYDKWNEAKRKTDTGDYAIYGSAQDIFDELDDLKIARHVSIRNLKLFDPLHVPMIQ